MSKTEKKKEKQEAIEVHYLKQVASQAGSKMFYSVSEWLKSQLAYSLEHNISSTR